MNRYANMRGTYFVKYLAGTRRASATDTQVASQATRTKVLNTVANTKAAAESAAEQELWSSVGDSVAEHSQSFDKIEARAL